MANFISAQQMALWLSLGGGVSWISSAFENQTIFYADDAKIEYFEVYTPHGELPENWCPFQDVIDNAKIGLQGNITHEERIFLLCRLDALEYSRDVLLKSADPRIV